MKYNVTVELDRTGEREYRTVDAPVGTSIIRAITDQADMREEWSLIDVTPVGERDSPLDFDPDFPNRPQHQDFARLSAAAVGITAAVDEMDDFDPSKLLEIDKDSLVYIAQQRADRAVDALGMLILLSPQTALGTAWLDGFSIGVEYQKRGGSRPTETGNTGEEEGSK